MQKIKSVNAIEVKRTYLIADFIRRSEGEKDFLKKLKSRASAVIPNILKINVDIIQNEKYLLPIVFKGGSGTRGRRRLKNKMKGDIDDGCMRSIAMTINGAQKIKAYIGFPVKV